MASVVSAESLGPCVEHGCLPPFCREVTRSLKDFSSSKRMNTGEKVSPLMSRSPGGRISKSCQCPDTLRVSPCLLCVPLGSGQGHISPSLIVCFIFTFKIHTKKKKTHGDVEHEMWVSDRVLASQHRPWARSPAQQTGPLSERVLVFRCLWTAAFSYPED